MNESPENDISISSKSLIEHILERRESEIITGRLKPGQKLREEELSAAWNVSRSPLREAPRIPAGQGLSDHETKAGHVCRASGQRGNNRSVSGPRLPGKLRHLSDRAE